MAVAPCNLFISLLNTVGTTNSIFRRRKLRRRVVKKPTQGHTANQRLGRLTVESLLSSHTLFPPQPEKPRNLNSELRSPAQTYMGLYKALGPVPCASPVWQSPKEGCTFLTPIVQLKKQRLREVRLALCIKVTAGFRSRSSGLRSPPFPCCLRPPCFCPPGGWDEDGADAGIS